MPELAGFGVTQFGAKQFNAETQLAAIIQPQNSEIFPRNQIGWGHGLERGYDRPGIFAPQVINEAPEFTSIQITNVKGDLLGKIRTDIERPIVESLTFTRHNRGGCRNFKLRLNKLPAFPILPFSIIIVRIGDSDFDWYRGIIDYPEQRGTPREIFEFKGNGFFTYLKGLKAVDPVTGDSDTFAAATDVGAIVSTLVQTRMAPFSPIKFNPAKINILTGVLTANPLDFGKQFLDKVLDVLADMSGHTWGIDGNADFYFEKNPTEESFNRTYFIGYDVQDFHPTENLPEVKNAIMVQRQPDKGSALSGYEFPVGVFNDPSSVSKYGRRELNYSVPGFFSIADITTVGDALLAEKKEPKLSAKVTGIRIKSAIDFKERGNDRFVLPLDNFESLYSDVDDFNEFALFGGGDLTVADDDVLFVHAAGSVKLEYTAAPGARAEITQNLKGNIQTVRFFVRGYKKGAYATVGIGLTNWDEEKIVLDIPAGQTFFPFEWDVSGLGIEEINKFAIRIDEATATGAGQINIDKIEFVLKGNQHFILKAEQDVYNFSPNSTTITSEYGKLPPKMENYLAGLFAQADEMRLAMENR